jgi:Predicted membrane protein (DUF2232)
MQKYRSPNQIMLYFVLALSLVACGGNAGAGTTAKATATPDTTNNQPGTVPKGLPLYCPISVTIDRQDNLFVSDNDSATIHERIIKLSPAGQELGEWHIFPPGRLGTAQGPGNAAFDAQGNLYIINLDNFKIVRGFLTLERNIRQDLWCRADCTRGLVCRYTKRYNAADMVVCHKMKNGLQRTGMFRRLTAIEIAEGALLADIGVIFQLLALYLPIGKEIFQILTPIVFAIIVLRRDFYVGIMSLCIALFTIGIMSGPGALPFMLLECGAGLFLGLTMKHRISHFWIIILGTTSGALAFYLLLIVTDFLTGIPLSDLVKSLHAAFNGAVTLVGVIASSVGLGRWWHSNLLPVVNTVARFAFTYWLIGFYLLMWIVLLPVVIVVYYVTNLFTRLLDYKVRPFPSGMIERFLYWSLHALTRLIPERGRIGRHWMAQNLRKEVRRLGIARQKSK